MVCSYVYVFEDESYNLIDLICMRSVVRPGSQQPQAQNAGRKPHFATLSSGPTIHVDQQH